MSAALVHVPRRRGYRAKPLPWTQVKWSVDGHAGRSGKLMCYVEFYGEEFAYVDTWLGTAFVPFRIMEAYGNEFFPFQRSFQEIMSELSAKLKL